MKITDILRSGRPSVSFEVFPPKREAPLEPVKDAVRRLAAERPAFMSVTYGAAGGSSSANTGAIAEYVQKECGVTALAHFTCVKSTREDVAAESDRLVAAGLENVLALRGDLGPLPAFVRNSSVGSHKIRCEHLVKTLRRHVQIHYDHAG